jgi:hypothetical protein
MVLGGVLAQWGRLSQFSSWEENLNGFPCSEKAALQLIKLRGFLLYSLIVIEGLALSLARTLYPFGVDVNTFFNAKNLVRSWKFLTNLSIQKTTGDRILRRG